MRGALGRVAWGGLADVEGSMNDPGTPGGRRRLLAFREGRGDRLPDRPTSRRPGPGETQPIGRRAPCARRTSGMPQNRADFISVDWSGDDVSGM